MTTNPKARKFRVKRSPAASGEVQTPAAAQPSTAAAAPAAPKPAKPATPPRQPEEQLFEDTSDGFTGGPFPGSAAARSGEITDAAEVATDREIDAIRREGLTGRQLRMARRIAQKNGLAPTSDFDAVRLLRHAGIDPFKRSTMLGLVAAETDNQDDGAPQNLPQTVPNRETLPSTELAKPQQAREYAIAEIQRDIARRRRRKGALLLARLAFFVGVPTLIAGYYYYNVATPFYATQTEFVIQKADSPSASPASGLLSGTGMATSQDSITVQSYLQSRDAMLRLDSDIGFKSHYSQDFIDPIQRLSPDATNEAAYKVYQHHVSIGYDPSEGLIKMEVVAADPDVSAAYSRALISYAEEQVDALTQRLREDKMAGARDSYDEAEANMLAAQQRVLELQEQLGVLDPTSESGAIMGQITSFETQLQEKRLQLQQLLDNERPNQARVDGVRGDIRRLEALIADLRSSLTDGSGSNTSLARITSELRLAELDLETRTVMMQQSLQALENARIEASRQTRYLSMGVSPVPPDEATYPRKFENTLLAFLIFSGLYLMASLTASILREQISA